MKNKWIAMIGIIALIGVFTSCGKQEEASADSVADTQTAEESGTGDAKGKPIITKEKLKEYVDTLDISGPNVVVWNEKEKQGSIIADPNGQRIELQEGEKLVVVGDSNLSFYNVSDGWDSFAENGLNALYYDLAGKIQKEEVASLYCRQGEIGVGEEHFFSFVVAKPGFEQIDEIWNDMGQGYFPIEEQEVYRTEDIIVTPSHINRGESSMSLYLDVTSADGTTITDILEYPDCNIYIDGMDLPVSLGPHGSKTEGADDYEYIGEIRIPYMYLNMAGIKKIQEIELEFKSKDSDTWEKPISIKTNGVSIEDYVMEMSGEVIYDENGVVITMYTPSVASKNGEAKEYSDFDVYYFVENKTGGAIDVYPTVFTDGEEMLYPSYFHTTKEGKVFELFWIMYYMEDFEDISDMTLTINLSIENESGVLGEVSKDIYYQ